MSLLPSSIHFPPSITASPKKNHYQLTDSRDRWPCFSRRTPGNRSASRARARPAPGRGHVWESQQPIWFDCRSITEKMKLFFIIAIMCQVICSVTQLMTAARPLGSHHLRVPSITRAEADALSLIYAGPEAFWPINSWRKGFTKGNMSVQNKSCVGYVTEMRISRILGIKLVTDRTCVWMNRERRRCMKRRRNCKWGKKKILKSVALLQRKVEIKRGLLKTWSHHFYCSPQVLQLCWFYFHTFQSLHFTILKHIL